MTKYSYLHYLGFILLILFPSYVIYNQLNERYEYRDEFLIPLLNGCYYGEGVNLPKINLSAPLENQVNFSMGYEPVFKCWTMSDYNLNATAIEGKIEEINNDAKSLVIPIIMFPLIYSFVIFMLHKWLNRYVNKNPNGGQKESTGV